MLRWPKLCYERRDNTQSLCCSDLLSKLGTRTPKRKEKKAPKTRSRKDFFFFDIVRKKDDNCVFPFSPEHRTCSQDHRKTLNLNQILPCTSVSTLITRNVRLSVNTTAIACGQRIGQRLMILMFTTLRTSRVVGNIPHSLTCLFIRPFSFRLRANGQLLYYPATLTTHISTKGLHLAY